MIWVGYDTDDLTDRQNYIFRKLNRNEITSIHLVALNFLSYSVRKNFSMMRFDNYDGDCDFLMRVDQEILDKCGINLNTLYN